MVRGRGGATRRAFIGDLAVDSGWYPKRPVCPLRPQRVEGAVEDAVDVADFEVRAVILDQTIGLHDVGGDLAAEERFARSDGAQYLHCDGGWRREVAATGPNGKGKFKTRFKSRFLSAQAGR